MSWDTPNRTYLSILSEEREYSNQVLKKNWKMFVHMEGRTGTGDDNTHLALGAGVKKDKCKEGSIWFSTESYLIQTTALAESYEVTL